MREKTKNTFQLVYEFPKKNFFSRNYIKLNILLFSLFHSLKSPSTYRFFICVKSVKDFPASSSCRSTHPEKSKEKQKTTEKFSVARANSPNSYSFSSVQKFTFNLCLSHHKCLFMFRFLLQITSSNLRRDK